MRKLSSALLASCLITAPLLAQGAPTPAPAKPPITTTAGYLNAGAAELARLEAEKPNNNKARNVIIFIGDGMGVSTLTAGRIFEGQQLGLDGESYVAQMDRLPHTALVKTYSHDAQVPDSAPTATAIVAGIKTKNGVIGVGPEAIENDCAATAPYKVQSLFGMAEDRGLATGIVSTATITHATPASTYAHTAQRDWEVDANMPAAAKAAGCTDIARQMVEWPHGDGLDVMLGGGRQHFIPATMADPEYADRKGKRADGKDLAASWVAANPKGAYVWNHDSFAAVDAKKTTKLLGLFEPSHMQFEADRTAAGGKEPSLAEMTTKAIAMLSKNQKGYVLMVEAGRIDHAHHGGNARRALQDTVALNAALKAAMDSVDLRETLIVVTSDHSHVFTIAGYPERGNPILGVVSAPIGTPTLAMDGKAYTTLGYANGPGAVNAAERPDPSKQDTEALNYRQQSLISMFAETHGGDDVVARAAGPKAHLFKGTIEQNTIFHIMRAALGFK
ncbi:alkaline phosphatase [Sphingorhabdus sp. EL138]|uniref:alkaline phosphatase n=1 Tax=Sphingorhabdus sp. EL138 TaxID=2073156 RepID=UPI0025FEF0F5|nr:alkaline phosphatase [Sphingorhabdus sp. EL138]